MAWLGTEGSSALGGLEFEGTGSGTRKGRGLYDCCKVLTLEDGAEALRETVAAVLVNLSDRGLVNAGFSAAAGGIDRIMFTDSY